MKKFFMMIAAAAMTVSASAQSFESNGLWDNWFIGANAGVGTKTENHGWLETLNPNAGIRIGKGITPWLALAAEGNAYFNNRFNLSEAGGYMHHYDVYGGHKTVVAYTQIGLAGLINMMNLIGGYPGEPRRFEIYAVPGLAWGHNYGSDAGNGTSLNSLVAKCGADFALNLGAKKAWQVYVEPSMNFQIAGGYPGHDLCQFNNNVAYFQLNAGVVYKFLTSNGTHNFKNVTPRDQAEIDGLNLQISNLRNDLDKAVAAKNKQIADLQAELDECNKRPVGKTEIREVLIENLIFVTFEKGKSILTKEAKAALDEVAQGAHIQVVGTASPEGPADLNQRLSQARADVVADYLKASRGCIVDESTGKGVQGVTSNRLAVVYVRK